MALSPSTLVLAALVLVPPISAVQEAGARSRQPATPVAGRAPALPAPGVTAEALPAPKDCALTLRDQEGGCLGASTVPTLGLLYPMSDKLFVDSATGYVGVHTLTPQYPLDVAGPARVGDLVMAQGTDTLHFPDVTGASAPMIQMFGTSTVNADRMILGHSAFWQTWGLKYKDNGDRFVFQQSDTAPVMTLDMIQKNLQIHDGLVHIVQQGHRVQPVTLSVIWDGTADIRNEVVRFGRGAFNPSVANEDLLELELPSGSPTNSQYIEAQDWAGNPQFRVDYGGNVFADGAFTGPADFAEMFRVTTGAASVEAGDVLEIDPTSPRGVRRSTSAYSPLVAGVYSTNPGFVGSERQWDEGGTEAFAARADKRSNEPRVLERKEMADLYDEIPMAVIGVVPVKVSAENGAIQPGDRLVTARTHGHAMRADRPEAGTIVGKALEPLAAGTGVIRVLVTLQ